MPPRPIRSPDCSTAARSWKTPLLCARQAGRAAVTLLMLDLDHSKSINDRFGHATGDDVLRLFATVARANLRANDLGGRLGGEDFTVILLEPGEVAAMIAVTGFMPTASERPFPAAGLFRKAARRPRRRSSSRQR